VTKERQGQPAVLEDDLQRFSQCWNDARFFDAHETLEPRWIKTRDRGLRGLIQLAAAFHHLQRENLVGARTTLERAITRLTDPENAPCAIDQPRLAQYAARVLASLGKIPAAEIIANRPRLP
jgi:hypothetical protein